MKPSGRNYREWQRAALARERVVNLSTGKAGNLVDWMPGDKCRVFMGYDSIYALKLPQFEVWRKVDCIPESQGVA